MDINEIVWKSHKQAIAEEIIELESSSINSCNENILPLSGRSLVSCCWEDGFVGMREARNSSVG